MTRTVVRVVGWVSLSGTLLVAAGHTVYYLYYWEWVRAQMAATLAVGALVVAGIWMLLNRLDRFEDDLRQRIGEVESRLWPPEHPSAGSRDSVPVPAREIEFPWLAPVFAPVREHVLVPLALVAGLSPAVEPKPGVFIPVLLGTGLLASVAAGLIERTATTVHRSAIVPPATDPGRLRAPDPDEPLDRIGTASLTGSADPGRKIYGFAAGAGALFVAVVAGLWSTAHYTPEPWAQGRTELLVEVSSRSGTADSAADTLAVVAQYCARNSIAGVGVEGVRPAAGRSAWVVLTPVLDEQARRRFRGCLVDATLFRHRLTVTGTVLVPADR